MIGFGHGVTPWWFTEAGCEHEHGEHCKHEATEWEDRFQLTEPGQCLIDLGLLVDIERPRDHDEGWELRLGTLTRKDFGKVQVNLNLLVERDFDSREQSEAELGYQWQAKYRWMPALEVGEWDDCADSDGHERKAGPAVFGKLTIGGQQALKYNAA